MIKKEILLDPRVKPMQEVHDIPVSQELESITDLSMDEANQHLSVADKKRWVNKKNCTANLYFINPRGMIQMVEPAGWWY